MGRALITAKVIGCSSQWQHRLLSALSVLAVKAEHAAAAALGANDRSWQAKITKITRLAALASQWPQRLGSWLWVATEV